MIVIYEVKYSVGRL